MASLPAQAQETAGQMNGQIRAATGAPLAGAQVRIVHAPSGTATTLTTNAEGRFIARGLRLGGPYDVTVSPPGGTGQKVEGDIFLSLSEPFELEYQLGSKVEEVVVNTQRQRELQTGASTDFDRAQIEALPSISRDLKDIIRSDPKVYIDRFNSDAIQVAGSNNRFNLLTIDGVRQNDDFGLNNNGYPALRSPLSLDVIDQLTVNTAPFAVTYSGFQGGNINVVTKSGTNQFHGSIYGYYSSDALLGDRTGNRAVTGFNFQDKTYGGTFGGPIVKDRLFFFAGYEHLSTSSPLATGPVGGGFTNDIQQVTQAEYDRIAQIAKSVYNYDILPRAKTLPETDEKIFGKLTWNVNDQHRAIVSYNRDKGNLVVSPTPSLLTSSLGTTTAGSNFYNNTQKVDSISAQVFSDWTDALKTEIKYGYKNQTADAIPLGAKPFPEMQIKTPEGGVLAIGPDRFRHLNALRDKVNTIKLKGDYLLADHTITLGYEREMLSVFNAFVQDSYGAYLFNSIEDFQAQRAQQLVYGNAITNVQTDAAARFKSNTDTAYLQDSWNVLPGVTLLAGVRYDRYSSPAPPRFNQNFQNRYGFANTFTFDGRDIWQPRLAVNWKVDRDTVVRAGAGLFGGGSPNVWLSNSYTNDGVFTSNTTITRGTSPNALVNAALDNVNGQIPTAVQSLLASGNGSVNAVDPKFKIPSVWKLNAGVDHTFDLGRLGNDWLFNAEVVYGHAKNAVLWRELRVTANGLTAPDGRPLYIRTPGVPASGNDLVLTNTGQGWSLTLSAQIAKKWDTRAGKFDLEIGYAYNRAKDVSPATSSLALSNWDNMATSDINNPKLATSNYELRHNVTIAAEWKKSLLFDGYDTGIALFGNGRSGHPFSFTFAGTSAVFGDPRQVARQRQLFYVPRDQNDVVLTGGLTWDQLNQYIIANGLDKYRGQIAPRNAFRSSSVGVMDMRLSQEIPGFFSGSKGLFTMDIRNLTNLLNPSWGRNSQFDFPYVVPVVEAAGITPDGRYIMNGPLRAQNRTVLARQSVWAIQFGAKYEF